MLARRALAITPDKEFAKALKLALMAAGTVAETVASVEDLPMEVDADICAIHLPDNRAAAVTALRARLGPEAWIIVILGKSELSATVDAMRAADRVAGILCAEQFQPHTLAATVTRLLHRDIFGLEKLVAWGTRIHSTLVSDYQGKARTINEVSEFAGGVGVRRKYREAIEQCADEMLMNALYDAPVGSDGKPLFADLSTRDRVGMKFEQQVVIQYACDGKSFALSVRDSYGSFVRETLLKYLHKCLHSEQQIDRKAGGAGLGLYLMANSATTILFNLLPGVATEVICVFDITATKQQLQQIGVFSEKVDASGRLIASPTRVAGVPVERRQRPTGAPPPTSRPLMFALGSAIVLLLAIIVLVGYPRLVTGTGTVEVVTDPPGATIEIDGRTRGLTEGGHLRVDGLSADNGHRVVARLEGHADAEALIEVGGGKTAEIQLSLKPHAASVVVESDPPGATVLMDGRDLGITPTTVTSLEPGSEVELLLRRAGYRDTTRALRVPRPGGQAMVSASLPIAAELATVSIESHPPGAAVYQNGQLLAGVTTPVSELLIAGDQRYAFTLELAGYMPANLEAKVGRGQRGAPLTAVLAPGGSLVVSANVPAKVTISSSVVCKRGTLPLSCPIENGDHRVRLDNRDPFLAHSFDVTIDGAKVQRELRFGIVEASKGYRLLAGGDKIRAVALAEGRHEVTLVPSGDGDRKVVKVDVRDGATLLIP